MIKAVIIGFGYEMPVVHQGLPMRWTMLFHVVMVVSSLPVCAQDKPANSSQSIPVRIVNAGEGYQLQRGGKPYLIKGVGGNGSLDMLATLGGNSVRTWGTDDLQTKLDEAHRLGLTVSVGIWLGHERHGFNYDDADQVARQSESVREAVERFKNHPAVLLWGLGNEMEGYAKGDNAAIWSAINNLATMVKRLDPDHPTMTVVAEIGGDRVKNIHRLCPEIDIVGINSYAGAATIPSRYREAGGSKPYILTEFGPPGAWEASKTAWGSAIELTSTEKGTAYRKTYDANVTSPPGLCLGTYAFLWGQKQEATSTWFGLLLPDQVRLAATDVLSELWLGKPVANRCPVIGSLSLVGATQVEPEQTVVARLTASDPEGDTTKVRWMLQAEPLALSVGGDAEAPGVVFADAIISSSATEVKVRMPKSGGGYRLYAFVTDDHDGGAVANLPLLVKGPVVIPPARQATLPLVIYDEANRDQPAYVPTGWMGNTKGMKLAPDASDRPHTGVTCLRAEYQPNDGWAGVVWQSPPSDWGDRPGGWNLTGAKKLTFWARGAAGGEIVSFQFGLLGKEKKFADSGQGKLDKVQLTTEWRQYAIDVGNQDLSRIKTGFAFVLAGQGKPITFYLDDVRFE